MKSNKRKRIRAISWAVAVVIMLASAVTAMDAQGQESSGPKRGVIHGPNSAAELLLMDGGSLYLSNGTAVMASSYTVSDSRGALRIAQVLDGPLAGRAGFVSAKNVRLVKTP